MSVVGAEYHGLLRRVAARSNQGRNDGVQGTEFPRRRITMIYSFVHAALWFNQKISFLKKLIHSPLCCKTTMQTNCGLNELHWQQP